MKSTRRRNPSSLPSIVSIGMVLVMVGLFLILALSARKMSDYLRENVALTVYLQLDADQEEVQRLKAQLEAREGVKSVTYTSQEEAAGQLARELGQDFVNTLGYNPIPATLDIRLKSSGTSQVLLATLKQELMQNQLVRESVYQADILDQIQSNTRKLLTGILVLGALFLLIAVTLINSTIRLDLYSRRFIIRSMQLVGARPWFIIRPFVGKAIASGLWGMLIATLILGAVFYAAYTQIAGAVEVVSWLEIGVMAGAMLLGAVLLTLVCSYLATRKYLKLKLEELY